MTSSPEESLGGPPRLPPPNAAVLVMRIGRQVRERVEAGLAERGIGYRHLAALGHLARDEGISYSELARRSAVTVPSIQATLARLEEIGAVVRTGEGGQGRRARLAVTTSGRDLLRAGVAILAGAEEELLSSLPAEERAVFVRLLLATAGLGAVPDA